MAISSSPLPICDGYVKSFAASAFPVQFTVSLNGNSIYQGKAAAPPDGQAYGYIELRDILSQCFKQVFTVETQQMNLEAVPVNLTFSVTFTPSVGSAETVTVSRYYNWANRQASFTPSTSKTMVTDPLVREIDPRMPLIVTSLFLSSGNGYYCRLVRAGSTTIDSVPTPSGADTCANILVPSIEDGQYSLSAGNVICIQSDRYAEKSPDLTVVNSCRRWALYYVNAFGGWDYLVLDGRVKATDNFTRYSTGVAKHYLSEFGPDRRVYLTDIVRTWELTTGWLTDEQSRKFSIHIPSTPMAYLFDMEERKWWPVTVEDAQKEFALTTSTNGRRPVSYNLTVKLAEEMIRM